MFLSFLSFFLSFLWRTKKLLLPFKPRSGMAFSATRTFYREMTGRRRSKKKNSENLLPFCYQPAKFDQRMIFISKWFSLSPLVDVHILCFKSGSSHYWGKHLGECCDGLRQHDSWEFTVGIGVTPEDGPGCGSLPPPPHGAPAVPDLSDEALIWLMRVLSSCTGYRGETATSPETVRLFH